MDGYKCGYLRNVWDAWKHSIRVLLQGGTITTIHFHEIERRGARVTRSRIHNKQGIAQFKACHARMPIA
jgi:hypothetical protein